MTPNIPYPHSWRLDKKRSWAMSTPQQVYSGHKIYAQTYHQGPQIGARFFGVPCEESKAVVAALQTSGFTALHSIQLPFLASTSFPLSFLMLASYLSSLNQVQGCLHPQMQEYRSILAGPMLVIYPVP